MKKQLTILSLCLTAALLCTACAKGQEDTMPDDIKEKLYGGTTATQSSKESASKPTPPKVDSPAWDFGFVVVKGEKLIFPFPVSKLIELGFDYMPLDPGFTINDATMSPNYRWTIPQEINMTSDENAEINVMAYNPTGSEIFVSDALVYGIKIDADSSVASEVTFGDKLSTALSHDEVKALLGAPDTSGFFGDVYQVEGPDNSLQNVTEINVVAENGAVSSISYFKDMYDLGIEEDEPRYGKDDKRPWDVGSVTIKGKTLTFPFAYSELIALGFTEALDGASVEEMSSDPKSVVDSPIKANLSGDVKANIGVYTFNSQDTVIPYKDSMVYGIVFYPDSTLASEISIGDKMTGTTTLEEVRATYGMPSEVSSYTDSYIGNYVTFEKPIIYFHTTSELRIHREDGVLKELSYFTGRPYYGGE